MSTFNGKTYLDFSGLSFLVEKIAILYKKVEDLDSATSSNLSSLISAIYTAASSNEFDAENGTGYLVDVYSELTSSISSLSDAIGNADDSSADSTVYAAINELSSALEDLKTNIETLLGSSSTSDDTTIYGLIAAETKAREIADSELQTSIDTEASAREAADSELQEQVDEITTDAITEVSSSYDYDKEILTITYTRGLSEDENSKTSSVEISLANLVIHGILDGSVLVTVTDVSTDDEGTTTVTAVDANASSYSTTSVTSASVGDKYLILSFGTHSINSSDASTGTHSINSSDASTDSDEYGSSIIWINLTDLVDLYEFDAVSSDDKYITLVAETTDSEGTSTTTYTVALTDLAKEDFDLVEGNGTDDSGNTIRGIVSLDSDLTDVESWINNNGVITEENINAIILELNATYDGFAEATGTSASSSSTSSES